MIVSGAIEDPVAVEELKEFINDYLNRKMVLIAVVDNYDELGDKTLPRLAGCNITGIVFHDENLEKVSIVYCKLMFVKIWVFYFYRKHKF